MITLSQTLNKLGLQAIKNQTLRYCRSEMGKEAISDLLPSTTKLRIQKDMLCTHEMMLVLQSGEAYPSEHQPEIRSYLKRVRIEGTVLSLASFQDLLSIAALSRRMKNFFKQREENFPELTDIAQMLIPMKDLEDYIQSKISDRGELKNDAVRSCNK